jgi:hypothetical protein
MERGKKIMNRNFMRLAHGFAFKIFCALCLVPCSFLFFPSAARATSAATMGVVSSSSAAAVGIPFEADVALDTQGMVMNAVQGTVLFPPGLFALQEIDDGGSPISFWIEAPHETVSGTVVFSGIVPGGFRGSAPSLVNLVLLPLAPGSATIAVGDAALLRNDGRGSPLPFTTSSLSVEIAASSSGMPQASSSIRFTVPEAFTPIVASDSAIYGGKYFLAFATTDKGSGIDHYDVLEAPAGTAIGQNSAWHAASSPYLLEDQTLGSDIYVRAVSHAGTVTMAKVPAKFPRTYRTRAMEVAAIVLMCLAVASVVFFAKRRRSRAQR